MSATQAICDFVNTPQPDALRSAIRTLLASHNGISGDTATASRVLDDAARRAALRVTLAGGTLRFTARRPILAAVAEAMFDGSWNRIKACAADDCRWAYLDTSRNRSRHWCDMATCGNRAKARRFRSRHA